jgi:hypothetical protein
MDHQLLLALLRALQEYRVEYVVVGAVALGINGLARATEDLDLFVRPTSENVERLRAALSAMWTDPSIQEIKASELAGDFGVVNYVPPTGDLSVDLISRVGEAFTFDDIEWHEVDAGEGVMARVATPRMLYRMKRGTIRLQDRADAQALRERFGLEDD